jgi:hypothetical protein
LGLGLFILFGSLIGWSIEPSAAEHEDDDGHGGGHGPDAHGGAPVAGLAAIGSGAH